jgi:hypothetical protein
MVSIWKVHIKPLDARLRVVNVNVQRARYCLGSADIPERVSYGNGEREG